MDTLGDRIMLIIKEKTSEVRRWKELEEISGIAATTWQSFGRARQRATSEMVEAVSKQWPQFAFWLVTGLTDPEYGHVAPRESDGYPYSGSGQDNSVRYFQDAIAARQQARELVLNWWKEELGEDLGGLTPSELVTDFELQSARQLRLGSRNAKPTPDVIKYDSLISKLKISKSLRRAEILLETEKEFDYEGTEALVGLVEDMKVTIEKKMKPGKLSVSYGELDKKLEKLKERIEMHNKYTSMNNSEG
ncbi:hypothetical protein [Pseudogulbenkiania ferrooxidans]|uniref:DNA-binding protein n=1 Tax=Pseudogulbenkiania ferrooxidans 2002 TaxID=279714 RepID=B9Z8J2_9NEIS|nr:hypothetical protein [Pseudogulbenkiania ferrooxidans]EEG06930.1 hypothetical protein FuraDRAFT_3678 [Pseudogulbenkiania ferrooxidans 2002]